MVSMVKCMSFVDTHLEVMLLIDICRSVLDDSIFGVSFGASRASSR